MGQGELPCQMSRSFPLKWSSGVRTHKHTHTIKTAVTGPLSDRYSLLIL